MPSRTDVLNALARVPVVPGTIGRGDFTLSENTENTDSVIASYEADRPIAVRTGVPVQIVLPAYQEYSADGSTGTETITLDHSVVDSPAVQNSVVAYEGGTRLTVQSVDYTNNTVDVDPSADATVHVYYVSDEQATLQVEKAAPNGNTKTLHSQNLGLTNTRELAKQPVTISNSAAGDDTRKLFPVIPHDYELQISIEAPYPVQFEDDTDTAATASNAMVSVPINRSEQTIPGLKSVVGQTLG